MSILYVDAYDSFSNNIAALLTQLLHQHVTVITIDQRVPDLLFLDNIAAVVIGPGPGHPQKQEDIGLIPSLFQTACERSIPILGICLGFQTLCSYYGASIVSLPLPCHGHIKKITHVNNDIFDGVGSVLATCYNSLGVLPTLDSPTELIPLAEDNEGYLMAARHRYLPQWGLQFHPESCKSSLSCNTVIAHWWAYVTDWNFQHRAMTAAVRIESELGDSWRPPEHLILHTQPKLFIPPHVTAPTSTLSSVKELGPMLELLTLTNSSGPHVHSRTVQSGFSAEDISELCYEDSSVGNRAMLESTKKGPAGRYSIYTMRSESTFRIEYRKGGLNIHVNDRHKSFWPMSASECLDLVEGVMLVRKATGGNASLPFWGGFIGYLSYELGHELLLSEPPKDFPRSPGLALLWTERSIIFDNSEHITIVQSTRQNDDKWLDKMAARIDGKSNISQSKGLQTHQDVPMLSYKLPNESTYKRKITACQNHLRAGNSYELCLTAEALVTTPAGMAWDLYRELRRCNPVPYAAYLHLHNITVVSSSPEQFLVWGRDGALDMRPMKGTVRKDPSMTRLHAEEILKTPKEQAENLMIADLIRHDLYSVVGFYGRVRVRELCAVVEHETVYQLVSHLHADAPKCPDFSEDEKQRRVIHRGHDALRHCLPPGSMTGAPKRRSCEILAGLEERSRGVYSGVIGYLDVGGGGGFSVCIRSAFANTDHNGDGTQSWRIGAGGAITVLSNADAEWDEMQTKLESVLKAFST